MRNMYFENLKRMPKEQIVASSTSLIQYLLSNLDVELKYNRAKYNKRQNFIKSLRNLFRYDVGAIKQCY